VFSFCLYGPHTPKYYTGLLENLKLIALHFPEWGVFVYLGNDVPDAFQTVLQGYHQVRIRQTSQNGPILMMHRFLAIDEPGVECMMVRDADSRIHYRDRWAIQEFVKSPHIAHAIRDHRFHTMEMLGGLWGLKRCDVSMTELVTPHLKAQWAFGKDQEFLRSELYPLIRTRLLVATSRSYRYSTEETHVQFPYQYDESCYCGKAEGNNPRPLLRIFRR
jgi:hypothetical protein